MEHGTLAYAACVHCCAAHAWMVVDMTYINTRTIMPNAARTALHTPLAHKTWRSETAAQGCACGANATRPHLTAHAPPANDMMILMQPAPQTRRCGSSTT